MNKVDDKKQAEEYLDGWKRAKADLINYQKQVEKNQSDWIQFANAESVKRFLPVLDSLESAAVQVEGVEKIRDQMLEVLKGLGVEPIESIGHPVDPHQHEVAAVEMNEEQEAGTIVKEVQKGYYLNGKVLRAAKVIISEKQKVEL